MAGRVAGKVAFVAGAARRKDLGHARRPAEEGADIIAVDRCETIPDVAPPYTEPAAAAPAGASAPVIRNGFAYRRLMPDERHPTLETAAPGFATLHSMPVPSVEPVDVASAVLGRVLRMKLPAARSRRGASQRCRHSPHLQCDSLLRLATHPRRTPLTTERPTGHALVLDLGRGAIRHGHDTDGRGGCSEQMTVEAQVSIDGPQTWEAPLVAD